MALSRKPVAVGKTKKLDGGERTLLRTPKQLYNGSFANGSEEVLRFPVPLTHCGPKITRPKADAQITPDGLRGPWELYHYI